MTHAAGCYWTFFQLARKATRKLASGQQNPCQMVKTWTTSQRCTFCIYALLLVQILCMFLLTLTGFLFSYWLSSTDLCCLSSGSKMLQGPSIMRRSIRAVQVWLRHKHAGVIRLPITFSGCVSSTFRNLISYDFRRTNMFTCILKVWFQPH